MKILGISCGRKMSNTEILVKEALMGAQEMGAEVELIRLHDLHIKPCTGCNACVVNLFEKSGPGDCILKDDDFAFIDEKIMECDGLILGSPIYEKSPSGLLKVLNDRMGPSHDVAFRMIAKKIRNEKGITTGRGPDERAFKPRAASLIAVGGSEWDNLALPMLHLFALPLQIEVVDKILVNWVGLPASIVFKEEALQRAHQSGKHVAKTVMNPIADAEYIGESGVCPMCHSKLIEIRNEEHNFPAICGTCGVRGTLQVINNKVKFEIAEEDKAHSHVLLSGKFEHADELMKVSLKPNPNIQELPERLKKYKNYLDYSKPPRS
ncbi:flavodoxin family protein [Pelosinus propionicus]|uniref:NADPH-dependent FMN reductase n=1 Tax=Pelosinus propionicus DSM 13327 TaxID=1123291 RepID=A0A1I4JY02_9FIRM|nr:flavodoxin family protein [Pelosinus propionicus]SFL71087.1 NADPH-dependent FMN reductase [Pelosinus propionicus DSM 13327]